MKKPEQFLASVLAIALGACAAAETRFWKVEDLTSHRTFYTADTSLKPLEPKGSAVFVSSEGTIVMGLTRFELHRITEEEFSRLTRGASVYQSMSGRACISLPEHPDPRGTTEEPK